MKRNLARSLPRDRYGDIAPFLGAAAILVAAFAIQARLVPLRPIAIEFPPPADQAASSTALPEYSLPPDQATERDLILTTVLPTESVPDNQTASSAPSNAAMTAPDIAPPFGAAESGGPPPAGTVPLGMGVPLGAGTLRLHTGRSGPLSALATNLMEQIKRLHPFPPQVRAKRPALIKAERLIANPAGSVVAEAGRTGPAAATGIGEPVPLRGVLGGPSPLAAKTAPVIDGTTFRRRF